MTTWQKIVTTFGVPDALTAKGQRVFKAKDFDPEPGYHGAREATTTDGLMKTCRLPTKPATTPSMIPMTK